MTSERDNPVYEQSKAFAVRIAKLHRFLTTEANEYVMSKQVLRAGTSIGANIAEAQYGCSRKEFVFKLQIALKECHETKYWLEILNRSDYIDDRIYESFNADCNKLRFMLIKIICTTRKNDSQNS